MSKTKDIIDSIKGYRIYLDHETPKTQRTDAKKEEFNVWIKESNLINVSESEGYQEINHSEQDEKTFTNLISKIKFDSITPLAEQIDQPIYSENLSEEWDDFTILDAHVYSFDDKTVNCDCLIDRERDLIEKRTFPRYLFDRLSKLEIGYLVWIKIRQKPGSIRIDVVDGKGLVNKEIFAQEKIWNGLEGFES